MSILLVGLRDQPKREKHDDRGVLDTGRGRAVPRYHAYAGAVEPTLSAWRPSGALLVRQLETWSPREDMVLARVSIDILYPLIAGEAISPTQRLIAIADYADGLSWRLDIGSWQFIPPELTLHILRPPRGEWICLDAVTDLQAEGVGLTTAHLFDQQGPVARSAQSLFIARRT